MLQKLNHSECHLSFPFKARCMHAVALVLLSFYSWQEFSSSRTSPIDFNDNSLNIILCSDLMCQKQSVLPYVEQFTMKHTDIDIIPAWQYDADNMTVYTLYPLNWDFITSDQFSFAQKNINLCCFMNEINCPSNLIDIHFSVLIFGRQISPDVWRWAIAAEV